MSIVDFTVDLSAPPAGRTQGVQSLDGQTLDGQTRDGQSQDGQVVDLTAAASQSGGSQSGGSQSGGSQSGGSSSRAPHPGGSQVGQPREAASSPDPGELAVDQPVGASAGTRPSFTITDAATACAVSRKTITRKLADLAEHGAAKDEDGVWRIPVEALLAVGLHPGRSLPSPTSRPAVPRPSPRLAPSLGSPATVAAPAPAVGKPQEAVVDVVTIPRDRWDDLRLRLARAEAEAAERALALADARLALRALTAAPGPAAVPELPGVRAQGAATWDSRGGTPGPVPPAAGWVMGQPAPSADSPATGPTIRVVDDPGSAPPVAVAAPPARKRRWWQSAPRQGVGH